MKNQRAFIEPEKCKQCKKCLAGAACPASAIEREEQDEPYYVGPTCQGCGQCTSHCPNRAIRIV